MSVRLRCAVVVVAAVAMVALAACQPVLPLGGPVGSPDAGSTPVGCDHADELLVLTEDTHLDPACTYTGGVEITASDVTLDCQGAHLHDQTGTKPRGIHIHAPTDVALANVTVRNCFVSGFLNNVRVSRDGFRDLVPGSDYDHPFSNIVIENSHLYESRGSGVFVNAYVTGVTLRDLEIRHSGSVGIYLEAGSKDNVVERNVVHDNGYGDVDPVNGVPQVIGGTEFRVLMTGREGIAIDGSRNNIVRDNNVWGNAAGGIFLYKNCGEFATEKPSQWWTRPYGADGNLIEGNTVSGEPNGIWVGSRMAENQYFMDCSDPAYDEGPFRRIHLDQADDNVIRDNVLLGDDAAIRIEDDGTTVDGNQVVHDDPTARGILIGTQERTALLGEPVSGTTVTGNAVDIPGTTEAYAWIHGHQGTTFADNTANGSPAAPLVPGTQPTIDPFLFVVDAWLP